MTECKKRSKIDIRKDRDVAQFGRAHGYATLPQNALFTYVKKVSYRSIDKTKNII